MTAAATDIAAAEVPTPASARPRLVLLGTAWVIAACAALFVGLFAAYFTSRASFGPGWIPDGAGTIPLTPASVMLITLLMSCVTAQWVVWAIGRNDRLNSYLASGLSLFLAAAFLNQAAFLYTQMGWEVAGDTAVQAVLIYAITGAQIAMLIAAMVFLVLTTIRALGGQYSSRDREGVAAAALFWHASVAAYAVIWLAIYQVK